MTNTNTAAASVAATGKFTKKPVTIQAVQWTGRNLRDVIAFTDGPPDTRTTHAGMVWDAYTDLVARDGLKIFTMEGKMSAAVGDWIIKGVKGEHYPCKPDIFEATYSRAALAAPAQAVAPTRIERKVYKGTPEHKQYLSARFNYQAGTSNNHSFEWQGHRWAYHWTAFDDAGDYDLIWRPAEKLQPAASAQAGEDPELPEPWRIGAGGAEAYCYSATQMRAHADATCAARGAAQAAPTHQQIATYLRETGAYITNDASREAVIADAIAEDRLHRAQAAPVDATAQQDAERYHGLRARACMGYPSGEGSDSKDAYLVITGYGYDDNASVVDAAVDATRAAQGGA